MLGVSKRRVETLAGEGRLGEVRYVRGRTGKQADFDPATVEKLKAELEAVDTQLEAPNRRAAGLVAASSAEGLQRFAEMIAAAVLPVDTRPPLLTREQALEVSGLPVTWLGLAIRHGAVRQVGRGRAARVDRADVLALASRRDLGELVAQWQKEQAVGGRG